MASAHDLLKPIIAAAEASKVIAENDYRDDDGFLVCGNCHTRKESLLQFEDGSEKKVPCMCECAVRKEQEEKERQRVEHAQEVLASLRKRSLMDEKLREATFDKFEVLDDNRKLYTLLKGYVKKWDEMLEQSKGLLLYGTVGTGKTFGASCIANDLLSQGVPVIMTSFVKLIDSMRNWNDEEEPITDRLNKAKLLILDDLGAERDTSFALEKVYEIIDARYRSKLPLILTTNLNVADMLNEEDVRYARIYDRIFEMCVPIPVNGIQWRKREAYRQAEKMRAFMEGS